jgi:hypothetical protein
MWDVLLFFANNYVFTWLIKLYPGNKEKTVFNSQINILLFTQFPNSPKKME